MFWSKVLIPTLREEPQEAEVASHRLMIRAGMLRKLATGIYNFLPLGWRVLHKVSQIIREEMDKAGAQELLLPALQPRELWEETGRWQLYGEELMRLTDRHQREFCLGPTHEEIITDLIRKEVRSYRQLPQILYQIQTKFRDEIRPRFGIMRGREFLMKDAYSFDQNEKEAEQTYWKMYQVYQQIFTRCGLEFKSVEAETGHIGGKFSHEFMVLAETGEEEITYCPHGDYAANVEKAVFLTEETNQPLEMLPLKEVFTPNQKTVEEVTHFLNCSPQQLIKTLLYQGKEKYYAVLIRGDQEINEAKLKKMLGEEVFLVVPEKIEELTGVPCGFTGPVGLKNLIEGVILIGDEEIKQMKNAVVGGNKTNTHLINANFNRDFSVDRLGEIKKVKPGSFCIKCRRELQFARGIEVGHTFMLGPKYSQAMKAYFSDENGREKPIIMGCYGIGVGRTLAAAIEQNHDQYGIIWPLNLAPYQILILPVNTHEKNLMEVSLRLYHQLTSQGWEVLLDDRPVRAGIKFNDGDLIGIPLRITIGPKNLQEDCAEIKIRKTHQKIKVKITEIENTLTKIKAGNEV
jgi:prolyl-tRNA synthetase